MNFERKEVVKDLAKKLIKELDRKENLMKKLFFSFLAFIFIIGASYCAVDVDAMAADVNTRTDAGVTQSTTELLPVMREFKDLVDNDSIVRMNFTKMIDQVPAYYQEKGPDGEYIHGYYLQSIDEMIYKINSIIGKAPEYNETDLVGFPINTILNWTMGVPAGAAAFRNEKVNEMFRKVLAVWTEYLDSKDSLSVFNKGETGWCCDQALEKLKMEQYLDGPALTHFKNGYNPEEYPFPYTSWNDFFIRHFKNKDERPISRGKNEVVSACDSKVYNIQHNAKLQDWFWLKSQPYSLWDMLANKDGEEGAAKIESDKKHFEEYVKPFEGGTVYQAFLSAFKYHRWNSPVSGTIKKAYVKAGTYYSATESEDMDPAGPDQSQGYIAHTATRAIIYIEADNPAIGLMCFSAIGMAEVSSCIINEEIMERLNNDKVVKVKKGDELGYFQFGGSTHCLVFQKDVIKKFVLKDNGNEIELKKDDEVKMGECIAITNN